jgi:hypothetical protein
MKSLISAILWVVSICMFALLIGCHPGDSIWNNVYFETIPGDPNHLMIKKNGGDWHKIPNGEDYHLELQTWQDTDTGEMRYRLSFAGPLDIYAVYFSGFDNRVLTPKGALVENPNLELPLDYKTAHSFQSSGKLLEAQVYEISISEYVLD